MPPRKGPRGNVPGNSPVDRSILVMCDFDGTVCATDMGNRILNHFTDERWREIDRAYMDGEIGSRIAYARIASIVRGRRRQMMDYITRHGSIDPYFKDFYQYCIDTGMDVIIVSDGFDFYIEAILKSSGLPRIKTFANHVVFTGDDRIDIAFNESDGSCDKCGNCKRSLVERYRLRYAKIIYVGNGHSDVCPAGEADLVFAKEVLLEACRRNGTACIPYGDFSDVRKGVSQWLETKDGH